MIKIFRKSVFPPSTHQHGWNDVLKLMHDHLHQPSGAPAFLDDFVDISFGDNIRDKGIPYRHPWVGFIHHPFHIPTPLGVLKSAGVMMAQPEFVQSMAHCRALITFSEDNARYIEKLIAHPPISRPVPVFVLRHPTAVDVPKFDPAAFEEAREINCVGFWLRRLHTFAMLRTSLKKRYVLASHRAEERRAQLAKETAGLPQDFEVAEHLPAEEYDRALTRGIGFADYHACVASNTILEHRARCTPILVNPLPAIVEYLGEDYPLYYRCLAEAESKLNDLRLLRRAHEYLCGLSQDQISYLHFANRLKTVLSHVI